MATRLVNKGLGVVVNGRIKAFGLGLAYLKRVGA